MKLVPSEHPILKTPAREVADDELKSIAGLWSEAQQLIRMKNAYGMASNQVGDPRAWFIFKNIMAINPEILERSEETSEYTEGCLSYPKMAASIRRPVKITVRYINRKLETVTEVLEGMTARVFQHEFDHLQGQCAVAVATYINMAKAQQASQQAIKTNGDPSQPTVTTIRGEGQ